MPAEQVSITLSPAATPSSDSSTATWMNYAAIRQVLDAMDVFRSRRLRASDILVCLAIARHFPAGCDSGWVPQSQIARETGLSVRKVVDAISKLMLAGIIKDDGKTPYRVNRYRLMLAGISNIQSASPSPVPKRESYRKPAASQQTQPNKSGQGSILDRAHTI